MDGAGQLPPALKQLAPILKHASQLQGQVPVMSYLCSLYAIQLGLKIKGNDPASKTFLFSLMDRLERQRNELGSALPQGPDQKVSSPHRTPSQKIRSDAKREIGSTGTFACWA
jgi:hypothetical protein